MDRKIWKFPNKSDLTWSLISSKSVDKKKVKSLIWPSTFKAILNFLKNVCLYVWKQYVDFIKWIFKQKSLLNNSSFLNISDLALYDLYQLGMERDILQGSFLQESSFKEVFLVILAKKLFCKWAFLQRSILAKKHFCKLAFWRMSILAKEHLSKWAF